jgi:hypothetical protein
MVWADRLFKFSVLVVWLLSTLIIMALIKI